MTDDARKLIAWLREAADELETAQHVLDVYSADDASADGTPYSLGARIAHALDKVGELAVVGRPTLWGYPVTLSAGARVTLPGDERVTLDLELARSPSGVPYLRLDFDAAAEVLNARKRANP